MLSLTGAEWAIVLAVVAAGATLQGAVGFGMNLVAVPVLALVDAAFLPVPALVNACALSVMLAVRDRRGVALDELGWALLGRVPGAVLGAGVVLVVPREALRSILAAAVALGVVASVSGLRVRVGRASLVGAGAVSGFMGTTTSVGGPPMALLYQHASGTALRGRLATYFAIGTMTSLTILAVGGAVTATDLRTGLAMAPAVVAGFALSHRFRGRIDAGRTRPVVLAISGLAAVLLVLR